MKCNWVSVVAFFTSFFASFFTPFDTCDVLELFGVDFLRGGEPLGKRSVRGRLRLRVVASVPLECGEEGGVSEELSPAEIRDLPA